MAYSLDGNTLNITKERQTKSCSLDVMAMPSSDSDMAQAWDFNGCVRKITLEGWYTGSQADVRTFIALWETQMDGNQLIIDYISELGKTGGLTKTVKLDSFDWSATPDEGGVYKITYTMNLVETNI